MKASLGQYIEEYTRQLESGNVPKGYKGLMEYLMSLRTRFIKLYPTEFTVGRFYQGYMDMSYFAITPKSLKSQKIKIGVVFNHEKIRFEIWLVGQNKQVQKEYWSLLKGRDWNKYRISQTAQDSIIEHVLVEKPDFSDMDSLTEKIENETVKFIKDIIAVLS